MGEHGMVKVSFQVRLPDERIKRCTITLHSRPKDEAEELVSKIRILNPELDIEGWFQYRAEML
jgi:hypothetical protein